MPTMRHGGGGGGGTGDQEGLLSSPFEALEGEPLPEVQESDVDYGGAGDDGAGNLSGDTAQAAQEAAQAALEDPLEAERRRIGAMYDAA
eukprot:103933-Chlamydomonas_euryale.AAC.1